MVRHVYFVGLLTYVFAHVHKSMLHVWTADQSHRVCAVFQTHLESNSRIFVEFTTSLDFFTAQCLSFLAHHLESLMVTETNKKLRSTRIDPALPIIHSFIPLTSQVSPELVSENTEVT